MWEIIPCFCGKKTWAQRRESVHPWTQTVQPNVSARILCSPCASCSRFRHFLHTCYVRVKLEGLWPVTWARMALRFPVFWTTEQMPHTHTRTYSQKNLPSLTRLDLYCPQQPHLRPVYACSVPLFTDPLRPSVVPNSSFLRAFAQFVFSAKNDS